MEQWINGTKPPGVIDEHILVIGPDDFDDERHVQIILNEYTARMESVVVLLNSEGLCGAYRPKGFTYQGVSNYAYVWADKQHWPIHLHNEAWWKSRKKMNDVILERLLASGRKHAHVIAFWDRECDVTEELMELSRPLVRMKNFNIVRI